ncbi:nidogen-like domain-containing protein [Ensifer soli]|uniref:nidogen-like domain-containing protein n=1 Tax=Ciceribacter sp. sgz301302 TaxID=3342379 RepID=UPI0035B88F59
MVSLINGLGGSAGFGENFLERNDDGSTSFIDVSSVFESGMNYFGQTYTGFYINNNGGITFASPRGAFTPQSIVSATANPEITPFFADVDTRGGPTTASPGGTSTGSNLVYWDLDAANNTVIITWDDVGYFGSHINRLNAFQLVLTDLSTQGGAAGDFRIEFRYEDVNWTTGDASSGSGGLGGTVARAGFSAGRGTPDSFFELPQSGDQDQILTLEATPGNTGTDGLWRFDVSAGGVRPVVSIESTTGSAREGTGVNQPFIFTVTRSGDATQALTVDYVVNSTGGPNGADPDDLVGGLPLTGGFRGGRITFEAGQREATIELLAVGDGAVESNESFVVTLTNISNPAVSFGQRQATATILNDDGLAPTIPETWRNTTTFGDPHLVTLDGLQYDFQAVGEFVFAESVAGAPLMVQIRTEAAGPAVSSTTALATAIGANRISYDVHTNTLLVNGAATTIDPSVGSIQVGEGRIYLSADGVYQVEYPDRQTALIFVDRGDFLDLNLALDPARAGQFRGLVGDFNGSTGNDFALRDGTVLGGTLTFETMYGNYANSWRISDSESLFTYGAGQSTGTFTNPAFPAQQVTLDQFPAALVAAAIAEAAAAGITNPSLQRAAALDFLLTGNSAYLTGPTIAPEPTTTTTASDAPVVAIVGVGATVFERGERDSGSTPFTVTFFRSDASAAADVTYVVENIDTDAADFENGVMPGGTVSFTAGQTEATVTINVAGDTIAEYNEAFRVRITNAPAGTLVAAPQVQLTIVNDDGVPPPRVAVSGPATVSEGTFNGTTQVVYTFTRTGDTTLETTLAVSVVGSGASPATGTDFAGGRLPTGTVTFAPGQTEQTFIVNVMADGRLEPDESFSLVLGAVTNGIVGSGPIETRIVNDDTVNETLFGTARADRLSGLAGNDTLYGFGGNDRLDGGTGADRMIGGAGNDTYIVDSRADKVIETARAGNDLVRASVTYKLGANVEDLILTGRGNINGTGNAAANDLTGNAGKNTLKGGAGNDRLYGLSGDDKLHGEAGNDKLYGGNGNDLLRGGAGKDILEGQKGNDKLYGDAGADKLYGGLGADQLFGGADKDVFLYKSVRESTLNPVGQDIIYDFAIGDRVDLRTIDASTKIAGNQAFAFIGTDAFTNTAGELRYEKLDSDTYVYGDVNGDGKADFAIRFDDALDLARSSFFL